MTYEATRNFYDPSAVDERRSIVSKIYMTARSYMDIIGNGGAESAFTDRLAKGIVDSAERLEILMGLPRTR